MKLSVVLLVSFFVAISNVLNIGDDTIILEKLPPVVRGVFSEDVSASLDGNIVYIKVSGYTGIVYYEIESIDGEGGFLSGSQAIYGNGTVSVSSISLDAGSYTIWIRAGYEYIGSFDIYFH